MKRMAYLVYFHQIFFIYYYFLIHKCISSLLRLKFEYVIPTLIFFSIFQMKSGCVIFMIPQIPVDSVIYHIFEIVIWRVRRKIILMIEIFFNSRMVTTWGINTNGASAVNNNCSLYLNIWLRVDRLLFGFTTWIALNRRLLRDNCLPCTKTSAVNPQRFQIRYLRNTELFWKRL